MNRGYEYKNNNQQVEIKDDYGNVKTIDYVENLDEILVKENVIEQIQKNIESSKYALGYQENKKETQKTRINTILKILIPTIMGTIIISVFVKEFLLLLGLGIIYGILSTISETQENREIRNTINAITVKISTLRDRLKDEQLELYELKCQKESKNTKKENDNYFQTLNTDELLKLNLLGILCYQTGYNIEKLYKAYQKGLLRDILGNQYNASEIEMIESITEKQGLILARRKR